MGMLGSWACMALVIETAGRLGSCLACAGSL